MADVSMPRLSDSMEEGTILKWLKSDGDEVKRGDELVEIETDKANMTYEADQDGVLTITASEGDTLAVGEKIATIGEAAEQGDDGGDEQPEAEEHAEPQAEEEHAEPRPRRSTPSRRPRRSQRPRTRASRSRRPKRSRSEEPEAEEEPEDEGEAEPAGEDNGRPKASPVARRMARELGLELATLEGTGPGGRIVKADVEAASGGAKPQEAAAPEQQPEPVAEQPRPAPSRGADTQTGRGESEAQELTRLQQTVARRMAESKATAPDFVLYVDVDMEEAVELRKQLKAAAGERTAPSFNDLIVKAAALALTEFPRANGAYRDGRFELYPRVNVGVAVAGQDALVVPTIFDADRKSLGEIARESRALAEKVREGKITPPELSAGTFTVSNLGMYGIDRITPVINPPQAAILGVGALRPQPAVLDGEVTVRARMTLTLVCDHRILYGADAAEFLARIRERLENPLSLAL